MEIRPLDRGHDDRTRSLRTRLVLLVGTIVVLTGLGASLAWAKTAAAPLGTGVVVIETAVNDGRGAGTGMVLTSSGRVLTNNHVIRGANRIRILLPGTGRSYSAKVLGYSVSKDVALLEASGASNLKTVALGNSSTVRVDHSVTATGNADGRGTFTTTSGKVTALAQAITVGDESGSQRLTGLIKTSSELRPGDSGGPLFDAARRVIGMNTAANVGYPFRGARGGDGYAIPINSGVAIAKQIAAGKASTTVHVGPTAFLGVSVATDATPGSGALIAGVLPGGAAADAGLAAGDVITRLGGRAVSSPATLRAAILRAKPGARVSVTYVDSTTGARASVTVTLGSGPPQ